MAKKKPNEKLPEITLPAASDGVVVIMQNNTTLTAPDGRVQTLHRGDRVRGEFFIRTLIEGPRRVTGVIRESALKPDQRKELEIERLTRLKVFPDAYAKVSREASGHDIYPETVPAEHINEFAIDLGVPATPVVESTSK